MEYGIGAGITATKKKMSLKVGHAMGGFAAIVGLVSLGKFTGALRGPEYGKKLGQLWVS